MRRLKTIFVTVVVLSIVGVVGYFGWGFYQERMREQEQVGQIIDGIAQAVFIRPALEDHSDANAAIWEAIRSDIEENSEGDRARRLIDTARRLNQQYARPTMRGADDVNTLSLWLGRTETLLWLAENDPDACAAFVLDGVLWPTDFKKSFRSIYDRYLQAQRTAYLDGRGKEARQMLKPETFATLLLGYFGLTEDEADVLLDPRTKSAAQVCDVGVRVATGLSGIPEQQQIPFVRQFLTTADPTALLR